MWQRYFSRLKPQTPHHDPAAIMPNHDQTTRTVEPTPAAQSAGEETRRDPSTRTVEPTPKTFISAVLSRAEGAPSAPAVTYVRELMPGVLLSSVVRAYGTISDSELVTFVEPAWLAIRDSLVADPSCRFSITPSKWEELIAASYEAAGFDAVVLVPRSGDGGRDIVATRMGFAQVSIVDQVRVFEEGKVVDANDVCALLGALLADRNATKGFITTTAKLAPGIADDTRIAFFLPHRLELIDGEQLLARLNGIRRSNSAHPVSRRT